MCPGMCGLDTYLTPGSHAPAGGVEAEWMLGALRCLWVSFPPSHSAHESIQMGLVAEQRAHGLGTQTPGEGFTC